MNEKTHSTSQMRNVVERYGFDHIVRQYVMTSTL